MGTRETVFGPTVWGAVNVEQGILLLKTKPGLLFLGEFHDLGGVVTVVGFVGSAVVVVALGEDEDVVTTTEWVFEDGSWPQVDVRVAARSLVGGRTVKVPNTQLTDIGDFFINSLHHDSQTSHQRV